jgi:hypothetical protein
MSLARFPEAGSDDEQARGSNEPAASCGSIAINLAVLSYFGGNARDLTALKATARSRPFNLR